MASNLTPQFIIVFVKGVPDSLISFRDEIFGNLIFFSTDIS